MTLGRTILRERCALCNCDNQSIMVQVPLWNRPGGLQEEFSESQYLSEITNDGTAKKKPVLREKRPSPSGRSSTTNMSRSMSTASMASSVDSSSFQERSQR